MNVIGDLSEDACPVDAVDGAQTVGRVQLRISKERFDNVLDAIVSAGSHPGRGARQRPHEGGKWKSHLTIIESALDSQIVHIRVRHCRHLGLLNGADFALGVHDEDGDILLASQSVDGR